MYQTNINVNPNCRMSPLSSVWARQRAALHHVHTLGPGTGRSPAEVACLCLRRLSFPWRWRGNPDVAMALSHKQFLFPYSCLKEYHSISEKWRLSAQLRPLTAPLIQFQFLVGSGRGRTPRLGAPEGGFTALSGPGTVPLTDDGANQRRNNLELPSLPLNHAQC